MSFLQVWTISKNVIIQNEICSRLLRGNTCQSNFVVGNNPARLMGKKLQPNFFCFFQTSFLLFFIDAQGLIIQGGSLMVCFSKLYVGGPRCCEKKMNFFILDLVFIPTFLYTYHPLALVCISTYFSFFFLPSCFQRN